MQPPLTPTNRPDYAHPTAAHSADGFSSSGDWRTTAPLNAVFLCVHGKLNGRAMREGASPAGSNPGLLTRMCPLTHLAVGSGLITLIGDCHV